MSAILCPLSLQTLFRDGRPMVGAKILVFEAGTTTPKTVYQDSVIQASHPRPILTDGQGRVPPIYVGRGDYKFRVLSPGNIIIYEVDGLPGSANASDITTPGQTYPLTDPNAILMTGDIIAGFRTGAKAGFVRCNANTIGNSLSAASELPLGNPSGQDQPLGSAYNLFVHLWELREVDVVLPIYANGIEVPRGATAIADWNANRQIGLPDFRGRALGGVDGMGGPDANRLQFTRELTTTKGSVDAQVADVSGMVAGMALLGSALMDGTIIKAIDGLKLTLSLPAKATSSASIRFSQFGDAKLLGSAGGDSHYALTTGQLPPHKHDAATTIMAAGNHQHDGMTQWQGDHVHIYDKGSGIIGGDGLPGKTSVGVGTPTSPAGGHAHYFVTNPGGQHSHDATTTVSNTGRGEAYSPIQPSILLSWYIKL